MKQGISVLGIGLLFAAPLQAQVPASGPLPAPPLPSTYSGAAPGFPAYGAMQYGPMRPAKTRTGLELGLLYVTAALYGVGIGAWISTEAGIEDPGLFLIAPAVLGVAVPAGVYGFDQPYSRGVPSAIASGAIIGAGEGMSVVSLQYVTAGKRDAWGGRALARATAIGATLGAGGGAILGAYQAPSPRSSLFVTSAVVWGTAIGSMFGYGVTSAGDGYGESNDSAALGGLIGYNIGLAASAGLSTIHVPTYASIQWMWAGAGIGLAASLPIYLFYVDDGGPPAKRGLLFSGTATTLGLLAGALFTARDRETAALQPDPSVPRVTSIGPLAAPSSLGLAVSGEL